MKNILIVTDSLGGGGAEKVILNILKKINKEKYIIDIFLLNKEGIYLDEVKKYVRNLDGLPPRNKKYDKNIILRKINSLYLKIRNWIFMREKIYKIKNKYDLEIAFLEGKSTEYISKRKNNVRKIAWVHTDLEKHRMLKKKIEEKAYSKIDKIVCVSKDSKKSMLKLYPNLENKIRVIYNPILKDEIIKKSLEEVESIRDKNNITLIASGTSNLAKGFDILLEAHKDLLKEGFNHNLKILGDGPLRKKYEEYIKNNNLQKNTELLGFKKNPYAYMKQGDIFISSSRYEGYPLVLTEAIILGLPIIATNCTGSTEILENGKYGILVKCEDVKSLKEGIKKLISSSEIYIKYRKLSEERRDFFDIDNIIKKIEDLFDEE